MSREPWNLQRAANGRWVVVHSATAMVAPSHLHELRKMGATHFRVHRVLVWIAEGWPLPACICRFVVAGEVVYSFKYGGCSPAETTPWSASEPLIFPLDRAFGLELVAADGGSLNPHGVDLTVHVGMDLDALVPEPPPHHMWN